jgi:hypothetical protein
VLGSEKFVFHGRPGKRDEPAETLKITGAYNQKFLTVWHKVGSFVCPIALCICVLALSLNVMIDDGPISREGVSAIVTILLVATGGIVLSLPRKILFLCPGSRTLKSCRWFFLPYAYEEVPIFQYTHVKLIREQWVLGDEVGGSRTITVYAVRLEVKELDLLIGYSEDWSRAHHEAKRVSEFLGLPLREVL